MSTTSEDKTVAVVAYLTLLGFLAAIFLHNSKKTSLGAFHLRQMLGLLLAGAALWVASIVLVLIPFLGWLLMLVLGIFLLVLWAFGILAAINGEKKPMPVLGDQFEKSFGTLFE
ncbi:MAG: hypothetical protein LBF16_14785 [Pseudomonadales bacterium]|jgi:uncharacterized membrane protein|nr:hypothetical protein [Pseudomonadales bacterium]